VILIIQPFPDEKVRKEKEIDKEKINATGLF
jgi:hypothetical protein